MSESKIENSFSSSTLLTACDGELPTFSGSRALFKAAAEQFDVDLDEKEDLDWRALLGGAYLVDHLVDVEKTDIMSSVNNIVNGNLRADLHIDTQMRFSRYVVELPEDRKAAFYDQLNLVNSLVESQRQAKTASEVIDVRLEEADILASLLSLETENRPDVDARHKFNDWLYGWSRVGYLLDSLADMDMDYRNGDSGLRPTLEARAAFAREACRESMAAIQKTPVRLLGKCALVGTQYVVFKKKPDLVRAT